MNDELKQYVPELGRIRFYDKLKQAIKARSPEWLVAAVRKAVAPVATVNSREAVKAKISRYLPPNRRAEFLKLYVEARDRWDRRLIEPVAAPIEYPIKDTAYTVMLRPGTCDVITYYDVIIHGLYGKAAPRTASTIIDCGANIGLASAYFLARYPSARVIALEPDPINYSLCRANLRQFGDRAQVLQKALSSRSCRMRSSGNYQGTWASKFQPAPESNGDGIEGVDMGTVLDEYHIATVDILKMDIEGSEVDVLSSGNLSWLERIRSFQIETQVPQGKSLFLSRLSEFGFAFASYGEIMIAYK